MAHRAQDNRRATTGSHRGEWWALAGILLVGLTLRGLYLAEVMATPEFTAPAVDAGFQQYWARAIATGDWTPPHQQADPQIRTTPYLRPPGYACFLALIYRIAGPGFLAPRLVQMGLGLFNCLLAYLLARKWHGRGVGLIFSAFMAVDWIFIYFEARFLEPALLISLLSSATLLLGRWLGSAARRDATAAGVLLGLGGTVRPNVLLLIPIAAWWMFQSRRKNADTRKAIIGPAVLVIGAMIPIAPLTVRNLIVAKDFVLISSNAGVNLFIGNNDRADGFFAGGMEGVGNFGTCYDYPRLVRNVERQVGHRMKHSEVSRYFAGRALDFIVNHPGRALMLTAKKALLFWAPYEISHNSVMAYDRKRSRMLRFVPFGFSFASGTFLLGVLAYAVNATRRRSSQANDAIDVGRDRFAALILAFVVVYFVSFLPFFNASLYRVPIIPFLLLFAAYGVRHIGRRLLARDVRSLARWCVTWAALCAVCAVPYVPYEPDLGEWHFKRGVAYARNGDPERALSHFEVAKQIKPEDVNTRCAAAKALFRMGRHDEAIAEWNEASRLDPTSATVHSDLGNALLQIGRTDKAVTEYNAAIHLESDYVAPYFNLANLMAARGAYERAIELFESGLRIDPDAYQGHLGLGLVLARSGNIDLGIQHCQEAVRLRADSVDAHMNLGVVLKERGRIPEAIRQYRAVLTLAPRNAHACHNLGVAYQDLGQLEEAVGWYSKALRIDPNLGLSLRNLGQVLLLLDRPADADAYLERACALDPKDATASRDHGIALLRLNRTDEGTQELERAVSLNPADVAARMALATAYQSAGRRPAAIAQYRAVLSLDPYNADAKAQIDAIDKPNPTTP